ncbi:MAG: site-specific DNA-methyltransferase [Synechococcaceae bacterium WB6_1A_059]|nr:site-specific DNA-methyltransferase [Synechococcaceae bacterium WB6_1A_059]
MITTINGDMLDQDNVIKDNSIDLLLTDPPYNISEGGAKPVWIDKKTGKNKSNIHSQKFSENFDDNWDAVEHDAFLSQIDSWTKFWFKKLRKGGSFAIFISDRYVSYLWTAMEQAGFEPKRVWTWKKPAAVPFNREVNPVSACEYILFGIKPKGKRTFNANSQEGSIVERYASADKISSIIYKMVKDTSGPLDLDKVFEEAKKESYKMLKDRSKTDHGFIQCVIPNTLTYSGGLGKNKIHPTQKPTEVLEYFIELLSNPGDSVLDTFAGSGSTGVACNSTNRKCILIEKDNKMYQQMKARIDELSNPAEPSLPLHLFETVDERSSYKILSDRSTRELLIK